MGGMPTWTVEKPGRITLDDEVTRLTVFLVAGRLNVVGTDGPARVEVAGIGTKELTVRHEGGALSIRHEHIRRWPGFIWWLAQLAKRYRADVSVAVPCDRPVELTVVSGSVVASALTAGARVEVTSGRITLLGLDGRINAKLISGPIEALGIIGDLSMETVSGEITLADSGARQVYARTISGAVTCDLDNPVGGDIRLETTSGEITIRIRDDSDLDVELQAISGRVTSTFGELPSGGKSVRGTLGGGAGRLRAHALSGNIALLHRMVDDRS
jgi:hypothetical protein